MLPLPHAYGPALSHRGPQLVGKFSAPAGPANPQGRRPDIVTGGSFGREGTSALPILPTPCQISSRRSEVGSIVGVDDRCWPCR
ncbi:BQ5605_C008g05262 [Microbotryum silenes-dioicae]|uniref:BQ5605_C008g05262 protein n=1 Tax=Microbotryum silenes-dioicae TaxID=796604 RepID=A0A2X0MFZ3_9BASI|nr:BQ5605_C008g05262 [Microbotryum silenes-dioicae]